MCIFQKPQAYEIFIYIYICIYAIDDQLSIDTYIDTILLQATTNQNSINPAYLKITFLYTFY